MACSVMSENVYFNLVLDVFTFFDCYINLHKTVNEMLSTHNKSLNFQGVGFKALVTQTLASIPIRQHLS